MSGWIKLHRQIADNPLWKSEAFTRAQAWVDLILLANHKDSFFYKRGIKIDVKRGQLGVSEKGLADRWKWSRNKVKKFLKELENEHQIKVSKSNVTQVVTVLNYNEFQQEKTPSRTPNDTPEGHQKDTYKNDNKEKNVIYFDNAEVNTTYLEFLQMRKEIKKPATETAIKKQIKMLNEFSDKIKLEIINKSIMNNYLGLFKPKGGDTKKDSQFFPNGKLRCI